MVSISWWMKTSPQVWAPSSLAMESITSWILSQRLTCCLSSTKSCYSESASCSCFFLTSCSGWELQQKTMGLTQSMRGTLTKISISKSSIMFLQRLEVPPMMLLYSMTSPEPGCSGFLDGWRNMLIITVMIEGALAKSLYYLYEVHCNWNGYTHLAIIRKSIHPNNDQRSTI